MAVTTQPITVEEFERLAVEPENADRRLEFVGGDQRGGVEQLFVTGRQHVFWSNWVSS